MTYQRCYGLMVDCNVASVMFQLAKRAEVGFVKYGTTTERRDIDLGGWLQHLQEELMDAAIYIERIKKETNVQNLSQTGQCSQVFETIVQQLRGSTDGPT